MIVILLFVSLVIFVFNGGKFAKYIPKTMSKVILIIIGVIFIMLYIFAGMLLDKSSNKVYDFFVGSLIGIFGIALWIYPILKTGMNLFETIPEELSAYWILINIYQMPFSLILLPFSNTAMLSLIANLIPSILLGLGLKYKRIKSKKS